MVGTGGGVLMVTRDRRFALPKYLDIFLGIISGKIRHTKLCGNEELYAIPFFSILIDARVPPNGGIPLFHELLKQFPPFQTFHKQDKHITRKLQIRFNILFYNLLNLEIS